MTRQPAHARRSLDPRLERLRPLINEPRPHRGWIRAIRDALGMSSAELGARMGVSQRTVSDIERSEQAETVQLNTLRRAADALGCDVVYFLVPRTSLREAVHTQARRQAQAHLSTVAHHGRLEDQEVEQDVLADQLDELAARYVDRRGLWTSPQ